MMELLQDAKIYTQLDYYEDLKSIETSDGVLTVSYNVSDQQIYVEYWFDRLLQVNAIVDDDADYISELRNDEINRFKEYIGAVQDVLAGRTYVTTIPVVAVMYESAERDVILWQTEI